MFCERFFQKTPVKVGIVSGGNLNRAVSGDNISKMRGSYKLLLCDVVNCFCLGWDGAFRVDEVSGWRS
jgi:hypothetical protein